VSRLERGLRLLHGRACRRVRHQLAAHADHALDQSGRDRVGRHVARCPQCREELAGIVQTRSLLLGAARRATPARAPVHLADQLVAIAGSEAGRQLWLDRRGRTELPSARRRRKGLVGAGATLGVVAAAGTLAGAWMLGCDLQKVEDPEATAAALLQAAPDAPAPVVLGAQASTLAVGAAAPVVGCPERFECPERIGEMVLAGVVLDSGVAPTTALLTYRGGGHELVVVQQRGLLGEHDSADESRVDAGSRRAWQSGDTVICVLAEDSADAEAAEQALPHERPANRDAMGRLRAGLDALDGRRGG